MWLGQVNIFFVVCNCVPAHVKLRKLLLHVASGSSSPLHHQYLKITWYTAVIRICICLLRAIFFSLGGVALVGSVLCGSVRSVVRKDAAFKLKV